MFYNFCEEINRKKIALSFRAKCRKMRHFWEMLYGRYHWRTPMNSVMYHWTHSDQTFCHAKIIQNRVWSTLTSSRGANSEALYFSFALVNFWIWMHFSVQFWKTFPMTRRWKSSKLRVHIYRLASLTQSATRRDEEKKILRNTKNTLVCSMYWRKTNRWVCAFTQAHFPIFSVSFYLWFEHMCSNRFGQIVNLESNLHSIAVCIYLIEL